MKNNHSHFRLGILSLLLSCFMLSVRAQVPSDLMRNCNQWKITYPTGSEDKTLCNEPNDEYFYVNSSGDGIVFFAPIRSNNGTTPNSSYIRSELREMKADGSNEIYWTTDGKHFVYVKQAITHLPINKPHLVATQIHGNKDDGIDDAMVLRLEDKHLFLSFNGGVLRSDLTIKTDYTLGTVHEVIFIVDDGKHYCYYAEDGNLLDAYNNDTASSYLVKDGSNDYVMDLDYDETYFKIGNYTQSNSDKEGTDTDDPNNYGEVVVYDFKVEHTAGGISGVTLSPSSVDLALAGTFQLSAALRPTGEVNADVTFSSSDPLVATISASGLITGLAAGRTTMTVTTDEGGHTATSLVRVIPEAIGPNLALNKQTLGTGTHDEDNEVANLVDGLTSTRWSVSGFPQIATIDLGEVYTVGRTEVVTYKDRAYQFTVSISETENGTYTQIVDRSENASPGMASNPIVDVFEGAEGRFVKIETTGADIYTGTWVSLAEFRIFGLQPLGVDETSRSKSRLSVWPNPASDMLSVSGAEGFTFLEIYNQMGKVIINQRLEGNSIDISELSNGLYILKFMGESKVTTQRVIKR